MSILESPSPDVAFIACIEDGVLERQALLLFDSIRRFGGRFRDCSIYALSPRAGRGVSKTGRAKLDQLQVRYIDELLNAECTEYGSANRVIAAAHVESHHPHEIFVVLDSDTIFLREPEKLILEPGVDAAVRPVDVKGMCTTGPADPFDSYWRALCECCGVSYDDIPWTESFVDHIRIRASYNGGLVITRGNLGILQKWERFFLESVRRGLRPYAHEWRLRSGVSWVDSAASRYWGSNQAALSLAIWDSTRRVQELLPTYNYPLHQHALIDEDLVMKVFPNLVHVHYHWLFEEPLNTNPLFRPDGPLTPGQVKWLGEVLGKTQC